jgi:drug/metabolite transporter (DMT)-like permease
MASLLALLSALTYGCSDFIGGLTARRAGVTPVVVASQALGLLVISVGIGVLTLLQGSLPGLPASLAGPPTWAAVGWGAASGVAGGVGVVLLYQGFARGRMNVVAPVTAVVAAVIPVVYGLAVGEEPGWVPLAGVAAALLAVALVSAAGDPDEPLGIPAAPGAPAAPESVVHPLQAGRLPAALGNGVAQALGAGAAFGAVFIFMAQAGTDAGLWPLAGARLASVGLLVAGALATRRSMRPPRRTLGPILAVGVLDMAANLLYLIATGTGLLSLVAVLTSLYPASTVLLARVLLGERFSRVQVAGLALAVASVTGITLG